MVKVKMLRAVGGYEVDATREMSKADAERLSARGIVKIMGEKSEPAVENKMEPAPENKSDATRPSRRAKKKDK